MPEKLERAMRVVNRAEQKARSFRLTIGLREGYTGNTLHTVAEVAAAIGLWLGPQRQSNKLYLPGSLIEGTMVYVRRSDGATITEPVVHYDGDVSPEYNADKTDDEVIAGLTELAGLLSERLNQERIYLKYQGVQHILERNN